MSIIKLGPYIAVVLAAALLSTPVDAQQPGPQPAPQPPKISLTSLTNQGFEIKAAAPGGDFQLVFLQRGKDVFTCITGQLAANQPWKSDCFPME
jgi:hypothetical protein